MAAHKGEEWYQTQPKMDATWMKLYLKLIPIQDHRWYDLILQKIATGFHYTTVQSFMKDVRLIYRNSEKWVSHHAELSANAQHVKQHSDQVEGILTTLQQKAQEMDPERAVPERGAELCQVCRGPRASLRTVSCRHICHDPGCNCKCIPGGQPSYLKISATELEVRCEEHFSLLPVAEQPEFVKGTAPMADAREPDRIIECCYCNSFVHHGCGRINSLQVSKQEADGLKAQWACFACGPQGVCPDPHPIECNQHDHYKALPAKISIEHLRQTHMSAFLETHASSAMGGLEGDILVREGATRSTDDTRPLRLQINSALASSSDQSAAKLATIRWRVTKRALLIVQKVGGQEVLLAIIIFEEAEEMTNGVPAGSNRHANLEIFDTVRFVKPAPLRRDLALELLRLTAVYYRRSNFLSLRWHASAPGAGIQYLFWGQLEFARTDRSRCATLRDFYLVLLKKLPMLSFYYFNNHGVAPKPVPETLQAELHGAVVIKSPPLHHLVHDRFEEAMANALARRGTEPLSLENLQRLETGASKMAAKSIDFRRGDGSIIIGLQHAKNEEGTTALQLQADDQLAMPDGCLPTSSDAAFQDLLLNPIHLLKMLEVSARPTLPFAKQCFDRPSLKFNPFLCASAVQPRRLPQ